MIKKYRYRGYWSEWHNELEDLCLKMFGRTPSSLMDELILQYIINGKKQLTFDYDNLNYIVVFNVSDTHDRVTLTILQEVYDDF